MTDRELIFESDKAIRHLCKCLAETRSETMSEVWAKTEDMYEYHLEANYNIMNCLGDLLNGMDAVTEEDDILEPIFEAMHEHFPDKENQDT